MPSGGGAADSLFAVRGDVRIDFAAVVTEIRQGIVDLGEREVREPARELLRREPEPEEAVHDRADWKPGAGDGRTSAAHPRGDRDVRMDDPGCW